jgi:hypothetical protein
MVDVNAKFRIIFENLAEAVCDMRVVEGSPAVVTREELDEIDELRRIVIEVTEPPVTFYTMT